MIEENIKNDLNKAIKEKNQTMIATLRYLLSILYNQEIEKKAKLRKEGKSQDIIEKEGKLNDQEIINLIFGEIKKRRESISQFEKGKREDLAKKEKEEIEILKKYLPEPLDEKQLKEIVLRAIKETGAQTIKDIGKVMTKLQSHIEGRAEKSQVAQIIKKELEKTQK